MNRDEQIIETMEQFTDEADGTYLYQGMAELTRRMRKWLATNQDPRDAEIVRLSARLADAQIREAAAFARGERMQMQFPRGEGG